MAPAAGPAAGSAHPLIMVRPGRVGAASTTYRGLYHVERAVPRHGRAVNVKLSDEARDGWQALADAYGTDLTALVEILGRRLAEQPRSVRLDEIGRAARKLSQERKKRS